MGNGGAELDLSQEMLAVLPSDPHEQLDMARRITARAMAMRMSKLEAKTGKLRQKLTAKEHVMLGLQERVCRAQTTLQETNAKILLSMDEQLETFKRTLVQSLQDDDRPSGDGGGNRGGPPQNLAMWKTSQLAESTVTKAQIFEDDGQYANSWSAKSTKNNVTVPKPISGRTTANLRSTRTPARGTPRLTPTGSPKLQSKKGSPFPSMHLLEFQQIQIPTSLPTSRSSSPNRGSGQCQHALPDWMARSFFVRPDGSRLTYEQFGAFLANIKELNAHRQTRGDSRQSGEPLWSRKQGPVQHFRRHFKLASSFTGASFSLRKVKLCRGEFKVRRDLQHCCQELNTFSSQVCLLLHVTVLFV